MTEKVDQRASWTYSYDNDGLQTEEAPPSRTLATVTDHDSNGNTTRVSDPQGGTIT